MNSAELTNEAVALLERLISIPRVSRAEGDAANMLETYMKDVGLDVERNNNNLWSIAPGYSDQRPTLLLNAHIDTVRPANAWTRNPYTPTHDGDRLYGIGSNDDGASLVCLLQVFRALKDKALPFNLIFLASAEEEVSGKDGIESTLPLLPKVDVALVGEPTGMQPAIAEKGLMVLDVMEQGKSGHAARNEGDNAIYHAVDDIQWLRNYAFPLISPTLGPVKMTTTIINAGTQHNVIPDTCSFTVDVRSNELYANEEIFYTIEKHLHGLVKARSFRLGSSRIEEDHPLVVRLKEMGRKPFGSPTLSDQALMRFPSLKMGPGQGRRSHTADEFICVSEIEEAIGIYLDLLQSVVL